MLLKSGTTFTPEEQQVLFIEPRFRLLKYQYVAFEESIVMPGGEPYHVFEVE